MLTFNNISKVYRTRNGEVRALDALSLKIESGKFIAVKGPSGCGKSTLLMLAGGMLSPTSGSVKVDDTDLYTLAQGARAKFRSDNIGFVFQMFHLVPYLCVLDNVLLNPQSNGQANEQAIDLLKHLHLEHRIDHKPAELSAGEKQRCAIARAMINKPKLLLADEPTGNLDPENAAEVIKYLVDFKNQGSTVIMVTHSGIADDKADEIIRLQAGQLDMAKV